jgi:hypothetical protein
MRDAPGPKVEGVVTTYVWPFLIKYHVLTKYRQGACKGWKTIFDDYVTDHTEAALGIG